MEAVKLQSQPKVSVIVKDGQRKVFEWEFDKLPITIGRSPSCEVSLNDYRWVSRQHIRLTGHNGQVWAEDLGSVNGMKIHGQIQRKILIENSAKIELMNLNIEISVEGEFPVEQQVLFEAPQEPTVVNTQTGIDLQLHQPIKNIATLSRGRRVLEGFVVWQGQILDTQLCWPGSSLKIGCDSHHDLYVPFLSNSFHIAEYHGQRGVCVVSEKTSGVLHSLKSPPQSLQHVFRSKNFKKTGKNYFLPLDIADVCEVEIGAGVKVFIRYAPAPRQLSKRPLVEIDDLLQKAGLRSFLLHLLFLLTVVFTAPQPHPLKYKNLSPRVAKLLIAKPKPPEPPKPEEKPKEIPPPAPKIVENRPPPKKEVPRKIQPKPKKIVVKTNPELKKFNNIPEVKVTPKPPEKNVQELGALAALGALGTPMKNPEHMPVAINVNKNAGGSPSLSTSGVIGALKAKGKGLQAAGLPEVNTRGKGFGTGSGYGVQGLQGRAGQRGVEAAVVGTPKLMALSKSEGLTQKQVMAALKKYVDQIQQCYERSLLSEPSLAGRIEYEWSIDPRGSVTEVHVKRSDMQNADSLNNCIIDIFKSMKFPPAKNGEATTPSVGFPFGRM